MMAVQIPPGWPAQVPPPGVPDWEQAAAGWLLDLCPPDFRGYPTLRRQPLALAWLAGRHVQASRAAMAQALGQARAELAGILEPIVIEEMLQTIEHEQARLLAAARSVDLVEQSLRGRHHRPRW